VLDKIIAYKRKEVEAVKAAEPLPALRLRAESKLNHESQPGHPRAD